MSEFPFLSVIIPAYNAQDTIVECVSSMINQTYPDSSYQIIVVDNNSTDKTLEKIKGYPIKIIEEKEIQGPSAARNRGAMAAKGSWLVFFDADQIAAEDYLSKIITGWEDTMIGAFASRNIGVNTTGSLAGDYWIAEWSGENMINPKNSLWHFSGGNFAMRTDAFNKLYGFDKSFLTYEDIDLAWRMQKELGLTVRYNRDAVSKHKEKVSTKSLLRREFRIGMGGYQLLLRHPDGCYPNSYFLKKAILRTVVGLLAGVKKSILYVIGKEKKRNIEMVWLGIAMNWAECLGRYAGQRKHEKELKKSGKAK